MIRIILNDITKNYHGLSDIYGVIYFDIDGYCFPSKGWYDFISPILYWWKARLSEMKENPQDSCELLFADGDCGVIVHDKGKTVDLDFRMKEKIEQTIAGISKAALHTAVDEVFETIQASE